MPFDATKSPTASRGDNRHLVASIIFLSIGTYDFIGLAFQAFDHACAFSTDRCRQRSTRIPYSPRLARVFVRNDRN
jgi:hypothetical protein